jgi:hypothetical protein
MIDDGRDGEPIARGRRDTRSEEVTVLLPALAFAAVVLVNAVLFALLIWLLELLGVLAAPEAVTGGGLPLSTRTGWRSGSVDL